MSVNNVAVSTKDRPFSVVAIIVDHYTVPVDRPGQKYGSHGQGLLITQVSVCFVNFYPFFNSDLFICRCLEPQHQLVPTLLNS